jgi:hypothetical protein
MNFVRYFSILSLLVSVGTGNLNAEGIQRLNTGIQIPVYLFVIPTEVEPNNTSLEANTLDLNSSISGDINNVDDYYDYFEVTLQSDGQIAFSLFPLASLDGYLDLYDQNGVSFLRSSQQTGVGVTDLLTFENLKAGTYFIRVGGGGNGSYSLSNTFTATAIPNGNDTEPNDNQAESKLISINGSTTGHMGYWGDGAVDYYDYYSFTTPFDGKISFVLVPEITLDGYLDLYDQNGSSFLRSSLQTGIGVTDSLNFEKLKTGTYFIRVGGGGWGSYTLNNVFTPTAIPNGNDAKPNGTFEEAIPITNGISTTGHIGFWGNGSVDDYDCFSFSVSQKSNITINAIPESSLDIVFDLFTANGNTFIVSGINAGMGIADSLVYEDLEAGSYFIRISGGGYGSYTLTLSVKESGLSVENSLKDQLKIIPDRKSGILMINNVTSSDLTSVEIVDVSGKTIMKEKLFSTNIQIDFSGKQGLFLVKISTGKTVLVRKVLF